MWAVGMSAYFSCLIRANSLNLSFNSGMAGADMLCHHDGYEIRKLPSNAFILSFHFISSRRSKNLCLLLIWITQSHSHIDVRITSQVTVYPLLHSKVEALGAILFSVLLHISGTTTLLWATVTLVSAVIGWEAENAVCVFVDFGRKPTQKGPT